MTEAYKGVELPPFSRPVAVTHQDGGPSKHGASRTFTGVLRQFTGVLRMRIAVRDWPAPALSHLRLDRFVGPTHHESLHPPPAAVQDASRTPSPRAPTEIARAETAAADRPVSTDDVPEAAPDAPAEPRVRDVIRPGPDQPATPTSGMDTGPLEAPGRRGPDGIGVLGDRAGARKTVHVEETVRTATERAPPIDRAVVARPRSGSRRPADRSRDTVPPIPTVLRRRETAPSPAADSRGGVTGSGEAPASDSGESGTETTTGEPGFDDRPGVAVTHPTISRSGDHRVRLEPLRGSAQAAQAAAQAPTESPTATADLGTRPLPAEQSDGPPLIVRRDRGARRGDADDRRDDNLLDGQVESGTTNESSVSQPSRRSADRPDGQLPDRIDELLDTDALVDRLVRAFERAARIDRERRGR